MLGKKGKKKSSTWHMKWWFVGHLQFGEYFQKITFTSKLYPALPNFPVNVIHSSGGSKVESMMIFQLPVEYPGICLEFLEGKGMLHLSFSAWVPGRWKKPMEKTPKTPWYPGKVNQSFNNLTYWLQGGFILFRKMGWFSQSHYPVEVQCSHSKHCHSKRKLVFQQSFLRAYVKLRGCIVWRWIQQKCLDSSNKRRSASLFSLLLKSTNLPFSYNVGNGCIRKHTPPPVLKERRLPNLPGTGVMLRVQEGVSLNGGTPKTPQNDHL